MLKRSASIYRGLFAGAKDAKRRGYYLEATIRVYKYMLKNLSLSEEERAEISTELKLLQKLRDRGRTNSPSGQLSGGEIGNSKIAELAIRSERGSVLELRGDKFYLKRKMKLNREKFLLSPGKYSVKIKSSSGERMMVVELRAGEERELTFSGPGSRRGEEIGRWFLFGGGALLVAVGTALVIAGVVFGNTASNLAEKEKNRTLKMLFRDREQVRRNTAEIDSSLSKSSTLLTVGGLQLGFGLAAMGGAGLWWYLSRGKNNVYKSAQNRVSKGVAHFGIPSDSFLIYGQR